MSTTESPTKSRKFLAYLLAEAGWKLLIAGGLASAERHDLSAGAWTLLWTMTATAGLLEVGYILGQAYVDRYVGLIRPPKDGE